MQKEEFTQDDFSEFENSIFKNKLQLTFPIGQKLVFKRKYYFTANPFNVNNENININKNINNILTTQNNHLLFECGKLVNNNIYMCLADKVLEYAYKEPNVSEKYMCSLFFPNLAQKSKIFSLHELNDKKHHLYEEQKLSLGKTFIEYNKNIDLFYNMWFSKKKNLIYSKNTQGVESINFTIHPHNIIKFPLEILFKLINSTELVPFIKYNPGNNRGNIYRLYTGNKVSMTGKKIPFLYSFTNSKKGLIMKLTKTLATRKKVGFYILYTDEDAPIEINCEFSSNGDIDISTTFNTPKSIKEIEKLIKYTINKHILYKINEYLAQSGYSYILFEDFKQENIEIKNIEYVTEIKIKKKLKVDDFLKCISSVFTVIEGDINKNSERVSMQYKRVSNYNELDSIESFINDIF